MKHTLMFIFFITGLIGSAMLFSVEDKGHNHHDDDTSISFSLSDDDHEHDHDKQNKHDHGEQAGHDEHNEGGVELSEIQLATAGIVVKTLQKQNIAEYISAPGEVFFNAYQSKKITPRISAQIIKRHKRLGQNVKQGQALVSLSSVEMAQAQGELIVADREWQRVEKLGKKVVSERRFVESQIARQQAYAKVLAFGMTKSHVEQLLQSKDPSEAVGRFNLLATQSGLITYDQFVEGEIVEPGRLLFEITDESVMWVEARLAPDALMGIKPGAVANVMVNEQQYPAKVTQIHHQLDENTRTIGARLEVKNRNDSLHPGLFVQTQIKTTKNQFVLALPEHAVLRSADGDWVVFVEQAPGDFKPQEVEVINQAGTLMVIEGIVPGTRVVTDGAFFVQSEIAKSGFEVHNH